MPPARQSIFVKTVLVCCLAQVLSSGQAISAGAQDRPRERITAAKLISKVEPKYPEEARRKRVSGTVRLFALIRKDGAVSGLKVVSGDPLLTQAAIDAVWQWRYSPALFDGKPIEVGTTMEVVFQLTKLPEPKSSQ